MTMREEPETYPFWTEDTEGGVRLGLSESYLENLDDDPVGIELAAPGARIRAGETFGFLYTPEQTYELRIPRAIEIIATNPAVEADARLIKAAPYGRGWLLEVRWVS